MNSFTIFNFSLSDNLRERAKKNNGVVAKSLIEVAAALEDTLIDAAKMHDLVKDMHTSHRKEKQREKI